METAGADDSELVERVRRGRVDDYAELVQRHQQQVFRILSRYERDEHLVRDLAQDVFLRAFRALHQYDGRAPLQHWISRIAVRIAIDHSRARQHREVRFTDLGDAALDWLQTPDPKTGPAPRDAREILDLAMQHLKPEERMIITLLELEELTIKEISARTGWSSISVRVKAHRARARLRAALEKLEAHQ